MTLVESSPPMSDLGHTVCDADQHYYEPEDALTRHLDPRFRSVIRWIEMDGRRTLLVNDKLLTVVPNPTYDPVGVPGSLERYFRAQNTEGLPIREIIRMQPIQPEYRNRQRRLEVLDAQGVEFAWLLPSLGLGIEEMLRDDPEALTAVFRAYNRWVEEDWGFARDGRIYTGVLISLIDPVAAEEELRRGIEAGARLAVFRPAPVDAPGRPRSLGDPAHDRFWALAAEAGVVIVFHAADSGYGKYIYNWGESQRYTGLKTSPLTEVMSVHIERPIFDTIAAMICHGVFDRHPRLRVATVELGSAWVSELQRRLRVAYGKTPQLFGRDPIESMREHVWVAPFYEDDVVRACETIGEDHILLGSDWPHPEGLSEPRAAAADYRVLGPGIQRKVLRDNLRALMNL
jgi:predicted TIM-barrel fold metal-dependent hydrolase